MELESASMAFANAIFETENRLIDIEDNSRRTSIENSIIIAEADMLVHKKQKNCLPSLCKSLERDVYKLLQIFKQRFADPQEAAELVRIWFIKGQIVAKISRNEKIADMAEPVQKHLELKLKEWSEEPQSKNNRRADFLRWLCPWTSPSI